MSELRKTKILILEDSPSDAKLIQRALRKDGLDFEALIVDTRDAFVYALHDFCPDVILSDHSLSSFDSKEALKIAKASVYNAPFILVTGTVSEEFAVSIIKAGAADYILKGNLSRLSVSILAALNQKEAKEKLRKSEEQFQHTIDGLVDGIQIISPDWKYLYVNDVVARQGGFTKNELLGFTIMEKNPGIEFTEMFRRLKRCMAERVFLEMEEEFVFPDGSKRWQKFSMQPAPQGVLILSRDITDKKQSIRELQFQNEKIKKINAELDRFLYSVSHELRTPICNGMGLINIARKAKNESELYEILNMLELSIKNLDALLQNIRLFSEINRKNIVFERIDFRKIFEACRLRLQALHDLHKVELHIETEGDCSFFSDKNLLIDLLLNLLSNGIKFRNVNIPSYVKVYVYVTEAGARMEIKDNGIGIKEEHLENIFNVFYKANNTQSGNGLGLYNVYKIVEILNGKITVQSNHHVGTTFYVTLPNSIINKGDNLSPQTDPPPAEF